MRWTKLSVNKWIEQQLNLILDALIDNMLYAIDAHDHHTAANALLEKGAPPSKGHLGAP